MGEEVVELFEAPEESGLFERVLLLDDGDSEWQRFTLFSNQRLQQAWRQCCGVRSRKLTPLRFVRFLREVELIDELFDQAEADLLFQQVIMRGGVALEDSTGMGYQDFCD